MESWRVGYERRASRCERPATVEGSIRELCQNQVARSSWLEARSKKAQVEIGVRRWIQAGYRNWSTWRLMA